MLDPFWIASVIVNHGKYQPLDHRPASPPFKRIVVQKNRAAQTSQQKLRCKERLSDFIVPAATSPVANIAIVLCRTDPIYKAPDQQIKTALQLPL